MPLTFPANVKAALGRFGGPGLIWLFDLLTVDGTSFYFSDQEGVYPAVIGSPATPTYKPWIKSAGPLKFSRDTRTDAGDLVLQNLSGNTLERDMWKAMRDHELEGALGVLRRWEPSVGYALREFHCQTTQPGSDDEAVTPRLVQIGDPNSIVIPSYTFTELCGWRYKSPMCGSTSGLADCNKTVANCVTRGARERFRGIPLATPSTVQGLY
jgi:hypothetical protein